MALIVAKFGGSSLCEGHMFAHVTRLINKEPARRVIVVSAPGKRCAGDDKVTDLLLGFSRTLDEALWRAVRARFQEIARTLAGNVDALLEDVRARICADARPMYAASRGEYLTAKLLARALDYQFLDAADCVRFSEDASLDKEATCALLCARTDVARGTVIPGFYGQTHSGSVTTFPRGGSDITGALAACALKADLYENWTDVDGVFTSDPAHGADAKLLKQISYSEMRALCARGANVLHPDSLAPVMEARIPVLVRNTFRPDAPGTRICFEGEARFAVQPS